LADQAGRCVICERYGLGTRLVTAAGSLAVDPAVPTPQLSEDERAVAVSLALARLEEDMTQLLPQVLAEPGLRTQLQAVAHCYLALLLGKSPDLVEEADRAKLPVRVARALGSW